MIKTDEEIFIQKIDNLILDAIRHGQKSFNQVLTSLPGVYPSVVMSSIQKLNMTTDQMADIMKSIETNDKDVRKVSDSNHKIKLPTPHPLDYDWRFSESSITYLLEKCLRLSTSEDTVTLLGTPSILRAIIEQIYPRKMILIDANNTIIEKLEAVAPEVLILQCDLGNDNLPNILSSVVIADPPWYEEYIRLFLWGAGQMCKIGGFILVCLPPFGTRPGIEKEWTNILNWAQQIGLTLVQLEQANLSYISPLFESNALRAEGINNISLKWRRGNLAVFEHSRYSAALRPKLLPTPEKWEEESLEGVRIKIRHSNTVTFQDPSLSSIIPGNILPSVSRRDKRRELVDIWTSGNRVFKCKGKSTFLQILKALALNRSPQEFLTQVYQRQLSSTEIALMLQTMNQINSLVNIERSEILAYGDET